MADVASYTINELPSATLTVNATIEVKLSRQLRIRLWLAKRAIIFAAWVSGMESEFTVNGES